MAYYSETDTYRHERFDPDVNEWNGDIDTSPWRIDSRVLEQQSYDGYYDLHQAPPCQLSDEFYLTSPSMFPPYYSLPSTLYDSSSSNSDRLSPSVASPESSFLRTPELYHRNVLVSSVGLNSYNLEPDYDTHAAESCVAMQKVQKCADAQFEEPMDDFSKYEIAYEPQELVPAAREENHSSSTTTYYHHRHLIPIADVEITQNTAGPVQTSGPKPIQSPTSRHRYSYHRAAKQTPLVTRSSKITKRPSPRNYNLKSTPRKAVAPSRNQARNQSIKEEKEEEEEQQEEAPNQPQPSLKPFPCPLSPYDCPASFSAKNEWKRHAATQHFRLGFWRCDLCSQENSSAADNDFNRKDLFMQHVRRMHPDSISSSSPCAAGTNKSKDNEFSQKNNNSSSQKRSHPNSTKTNPTPTPSTPTPTPIQLPTTLTTLTTRCHRPKHSSPPPRSLCVFCGQGFESGAQGLESRIEHMGKHMDARRKEGLGPLGLEEWRADEGLEGWMVGCGVLVREEDDGKLVVA